MNWYRCSFKILAKHNVDSGRTKHLKIRTEDVFARSPDEAITELKTFFRSKEEIIDIKDIRVRVLRTEWNPQQMAMYLQFLATQIVTTEAGAMKKTDSGILTPL